jgi:hypothetical protein
LGAFDLFLFLALLIYFYFWRFWLIFIFGAFDLFLFLALVTYFYFFGAFNLFLVLALLIYFYFLALLIYFYFWRFWLIFIFGAFDLFLFLAHLTYFYFWRLWFIFIFWRFWLIFYFWHGWPGGPREYGCAGDGGRRARVDGRAEALLPRAQGAAHPLGVRGPAHRRLQPAQQEGKNQRYRDTVPGYRTTDRSWRIPKEFVNLEKILKSVICSARRQKLKVPYTDHDWVWYCTLP